MAECPQCGRPLAIVRPACLYCGRALPAALVAALEQSAAAAVAALDERPVAENGAPEPARDEGERVLLVLDLRQGDAERLALALGLSRYEAGQRLKRGGYQLHRIAASQAKAAGEAERIAAAGVRVLTLPERDIGREPVLVLGGRLEPRGLRGRSAEGRLEWTCDELLLAVQGPIRREFQVQEKDWRRPRSASPTEGYRIHLHRQREARPLELDPAAFEFDGPRGEAASSLLRLFTWLQGFDPKAPLDDAFRLLPPALSPAEESRDSARVALRRDDKPAGQVLDNLRQFRFYSAWRGALERYTRTPSS